MWRLWPDAKVSELESKLSTAASPPSQQPEKSGEAVLSIADCVNRVCPWSGKPVSADSLTRYRNRVVGFCNSGCRDKFEAATKMFDSAIDSTTSGTGSGDGGGGRA